MKTKKFIPGFSATSSFSSQYQISFRSASKINNKTSFVIPAISCDACERVCAVSSIWDCLQCHSMCNLPI